jgi:phosphate/sulfate permease
MVEDGSVGMGVDGSGVGDGPSVGGGPGVSATTVLTTAVISKGVGPTGVDSPLAGMIGAHAERSIVKTIMKEWIVFIPASLF